MSAGFDLGQVGPRNPGSPAPPPLLSITSQLSGGPPSVSCAGCGGPVSPTLPSQPGGRPTGKLRLTWLFSTAGPACRTLPRHRGAPSKAPQRRGPSGAPKGWGKGSREFWESRPTLGKWNQARETVCGDRDETVPCFPRDGAPGCGCPPSSCVCSAPAPQTLPPAAPLPDPEPAALSFLETLVDVCTDWSPFRSLRAGLRLQCGWLAPCPGMWPERTPAGWSQHWSLVCRPAPLDHSRAPF